MSTPRAAHTVNLLRSGKVLVAGGRVGAFGSTVLAAVEIYDPGSDAWSPAASMNSPRNGHSSALLPDGNVIVAGGFNGGGILASTEIFRPAPD